MKKVLILSFVLSVLFFCVSCKKDDETIKDIKTKLDNYYSESLVDSKMNEDPIFLSELEGANLAWSANKDVFDEDMLLKWPAHQDLSVKITVDITKGESKGTQTYNIKLKKLTKIEISGAEDADVENSSVYSIYDGVNVIGDNNVNYKNRLNYSSTATIDRETGILDTLIPSTIAIRYEALINTYENDEITAQKWRFLRIKSPSRPDGEFILNGNFEQGIFSWDIYTGGGMLEHEFSEDGIEMTITPGVNLWEPRLSQMGVPFEKDKTYEISFDAIASKPKGVNLQVGELLTAEPYFVDFKPNIVIQKMIETTWKTYSYKFTHRENNDRGGVIFEFGWTGIEAKQSDFEVLIKMKNIVVKESTPDIDIEGPVFSGIKDRVSVVIHSEVNPLMGITAYDAGDGEDKTESITYEIFDSNNEKVTEMDTSKEGVYKVIYEVKDNSDNKRTAQTYFEIVDLHYYEDELFINGYFENELNAENPEWWTWSGGTADFDGYIDVANTKYVVDIKDGGQSAYHVQLVQENILLKKGHTYNLTMILSSEFDRNISVAIGYTDSSYISYASFTGIPTTSEEKLYKFLFTVFEDTHLVTFAFEMGMQYGFSTGKVNIHEVYFSEAITEIEANYVSFEESENSDITVDLNNANVSISQIDASAGLPTVDYQADDLKKGDYGIVLNLETTVNRDLRLTIYSNDQKVKTVIFNSFDDFINLTIDEDLTDVSIIVEFGNLEGDYVSLPGSFTIPKTFYIYRIY